MNQATRLPDILLYVFEHTDSETDVSCAQVCRLWNDNILDILWYRVTQIRRLFKILGPLEKLNHNLMTFTHHHISNERWKRFSFYADRVRYLECRDHSPGIHSQSFATLAISRPVLHLFPNLVHLTWRCDPGRPAPSLTLALLFLHPGLVSLTVETGQDSSPGDLFAINNFFSDVVVRAPHIRHLDFRSQIPLHDLGPGLAKFVVGLTQLRTVLLSDALLASDVITALAKCPNLEAIRLPPPHELTTMEDGDLDDLENFIPVVGPNSFPCLTEIAFLAHLWNATRFLQNILPGSSLRRILVRTLSVECSENLAIFFDAVASDCPGIESLAVSVVFRDITGAEPVPFSCMEPMLACHALTSFTFATPCPLAITDSQLTTLAVAWPRLEILKLNPAPFPQWDPAALTLSALPILGEHCPNLRELALLVHPDMIPTPSPAHPLRRLTSLRLGVTGYRYDEQDLALFLAMATPPSCCILPAALYPLWELVQDNSSLCENTETCEAMFDAALALLPMLRRVHAQYQDRIRALEDEVRRLSLDRKGKGVDRG
ncbi:hypothetical protein C8R44DRAFT_101075 [Mycena epipterygia]|nr:hypothetical protein C8R44DRAFT_101075 [Mycena epipterygia]